jgi:hypothetical protein
MSCTDLIATIQPEDEWRVIGSGKIMLYYRGEDFSREASPTAEQANYIVDAQNIYYQAIQDSIGKEYHDNVMVYLFNRDEALDKIGTDGGGHAIPKLSTYYFAFIDSNRSITDHFGVVDPYIGAHELVHVITHRTLGYPKTKLLSEGYAVWLDGTFARFSIEEVIRYYRDEDPEKILTPDVMIYHDKDYVSSVFYPNAGIFVKFLVKRFGINAINAIFTVSEEYFISELESISGESWETITTAYTSFINDL